MMCDFTAHAKFTVAHSLDRVRARKIRATRLFLTLLLLYNIYYNPLLAGLDQ